MGGIRDRFDSTLASLKRLAVRNLTMLWLVLPVALLAAGVAGYGWWWQVVADGMRANVMQFQAQQLALGREAQWESFRIDGFPYRVQGTLSGVHLTAPDRGAAYDGERVVAHVEPLNLKHVVLSLEGQQHFFYAHERWIEAKARADTSLLTLSGERDADSIRLEFERLTGSAKFDEKDFNFIVEKARGGLTISKPEKEGAAPKVALQARLQNVALQGGFELPLGQSIVWIDLDAAASVPKTLADASASGLIDAWRTAGTPIEIKRFELEWGGVTLAASGQVKIDSQSMPEGRLFVTLGNHPLFLQLLREAGWIKPETETIARKVLDVLAFMSGDEKRRVSVPLRIEKGDVYLGPAHVATLTPQPIMAQPDLPVVPPDTP